MPYVIPTVAKPVELSWDAFPAPTPEAEKWKPDPDSIPVAGVLPDPRLNKDPLTMQQKQALKRDKRLGLLSDAGSVSTRTSSPVSGLGSWPAPAPRATGLSRAFASTPAPQPVLSLPESLELVGIAPAAPTRDQTSTLQVAKSSHPGNTHKGTMEILPVHSLYHRPDTPPKSIDSGTLVPPAKTPPPAWARPLAHLLEESPKVAPVIQTHPAHVAVSSAQISRPPHLRKQPQNPSPPVTFVAKQASRSNNGGGNDVLKDNAQPTILSAAPLLDFTQHKQGAPGASYPELPSADETFQFQKSLLESFIPKKHISIREHERYLQIKLISFMEDEMDLSTRMMRRELSNMSEKDFNACLTKTKAMHRMTWETK